MARTPESSLAPRAQMVMRLAEKLGFALLGIAPAGPSEFAGPVRGWIERGRHGEMEYMAEAVEARLDPGVLLPGARSVICVADLYATQGAEAGTGAKAEEEAQGKAEAGPEGRIARYAWGDDYHRVMKKRLHMLADALRERWPEHEYCTTVDTAPILEREQALRAGLGWIGKNTMLIHPGLGSWLLLGEIVTTLPLQAAGDAIAGRMADHCGGCTRCIEACPTACIGEGQIDATRCISYLTLEHRSRIDPALHEAMGDWIAGCDVCQEACPFNQARGGDSGASEGKAMPHGAYAARRPGPGIGLLEVLGWNAGDRQAAFERSALKRVKLEQFQRNALIAAGNALLKKNDAALRAKVEALATDVQAGALVRETARDVVERLTAR